MHQSILLMIVCLLLLTGFSGEATDTVTSAETTVTLSASFREVAGPDGVVDFTFELEEMPAASAGMMNDSTLPPQSSAVPEPSTLMLVGLGMLGLGALQKRWYKR